MSMTGRHPAIPFRPELKEDFPRIDLHHRSDFTTDKVDETLDECTERIRSVLLPLVEQLDMESNVNSIFIASHASPCHWSVFVLRRSC